MKLYVKNAVFNLYFVEYKKNKNCSFITADQTSVIGASLRIILYSEVLHIHLMMFPNKLS